MKYEIEEVRDFLVVHVIGDMTSKTHLSILDEAISDHIEALAGCHDYCHYSLWLSFRRIDHG